MAIRLEDEYTEAEAANANYPGGSFKNTTTPGGTDGTPLEKAWADDFLGARDAVMAAAGQGYSGAPDTAAASDFLTALYALFVKKVDAVSTATPSAVMRRDANGRVKIANPSADDDAATYGSAKNASVGYGQAWQSLLGAGRSVGVWYQNATGKPIMVNITFQRSTTTSCALTVSSTGPSGGVIIAEAGDSNSGTDRNTMSAIIPPSHYYTVTGGGVSRWCELR